MEERRPQVCLRVPLASVEQDRKVPPVKRQGPMTWGDPDRPHCPDQWEVKFGEPRAEATAPQAALTLMPQPFQVFGARWGGREGEGQTPAYATWKPPPPTVTPKHPHLWDRAVFQVSEGVCCLQQGVKVEILSHGPRRAFRGSSE